MVRTLSTKVLRDPIVSAKGLGRGGSHYWSDLLIETFTIRTIGYKEAKEYSIYVNMSILYL